MRALLEATNDGDNGIGIVESSISLPSSFNDLVKDMTSNGQDIKAFAFKTKAMVINKQPFYFTILCYYLACTLCKCYYILVEFSKQIYFSFGGLNTWSIFFGILEESEQHSCAFHLIIYSCHYILVDLYIKNRCVILLVSFGKIKRLFFFFFNIILSIK